MLVLFAQIFYLPGIVFRTARLATVLAFPCTEYAGTGLRYSTLGKFGRVWRESRVHVLCVVRHIFFCKKLKNISCEYNREWLKLNFASCVVHQTRSYHKYFEVWFL